METSAGAAGAGGGAASSAAEDEPTSEFMHILSDENDSALASISFSPDGWMDGWIR